MCGRCLAGKVVDQAGLGEWVRPVSARQHEEMSESDRRYPDGTRAQLLDIVRIQMKEPRPHTYQTENHLIDDGYYWDRMGRADWPMLTSAVDIHMSSLWVNGYSSYHGSNDRIPLDQAESLPNSLALIRANEVVISATAEGAAFGDMQRKVRARWTWKGQSYAVRVTDPEIEQCALSQPDTHLRLENALVCVSLGEPLDNYVYKLAAAIITPCRV